MGPFESSLFVKKEQTRGRDMNKGGEVRLFFIEKPVSLSIEKEEREIREQGDPALKHQ